MEKWQKITGTPHEKIKNIFAPYQPLQLEKENWKVEETLASKPKMSIVRDKIDSLKVWSMKMDEILISYPIDTMTIAVSTIKDEFIIYIRNSREALERFIRDKYIKTKNKIDEDSKEGDRLLQKKKFPIKHACDYKESLNNYQDKLLKLKKKSWKVRQFIHFN